MRSCCSKLKLSSFLASDQLGNSWGQLRANALPVSQTVSSNAEGFCLAGSHWVVEADTFYETAVTTIAGIGSNDVVERTLLGATTGQTNNDHNISKKEC